MADFSDSARTVHRVGHNGHTPIVSGESSCFSFKSIVFFFALYLTTFPSSRTCVSHDFYGTASVLDSKVETVSHAMKIKSSWFNLLNLSCNSGYSTRHVAGTVLTLPTTMFQRKGKTNQGIFD